VVKAGSQLSKTYYLCVEKRMLSVGRPEGCSDVLRFLRKAEAVKILHYFVMLWIVGEEIPPPL